MLTIGSAPPLGSPCPRMHGAMISPLALFSAPILLAVVAPAIPLRGGFRGSAGPLLRVFAPLGAH